MKYNLIVADPAWTFKNKKTGGSMKSGASSQYRVTSVDDICKIPVHKVTADDCVLLMWWVGSQPREALKVVDAWGFTLKTMTAFTWVKMTRKANFDFGMGFWTRAGSECCLLATKGKPKRASASVRSVTEFEFEDYTFHANKGAHSVKPDIFMHKAVHLVGDVPRLEMFCRGEGVPGYDVWGDQATKSIII